jgi:hypothetical protein
MSTLVTAALVLMLLVVTHTRSELPITMSVLVTAALVLMLLVVTHSRLELQRIADIRRRSGFLKTRELSHPWGSILPWFRPTRVPPLQPGRNRKPR